MQLTFLDWSKMQQPIHAGIDEVWGIREKPSYSERYMLLILYRVSRSFPSIHGFQVGIPASLVHMANFPRMYISHTHTHTLEMAHKGVPRTEQNRTWNEERTVRIRQYPATSCLVLSYRYAVVPLLCSLNEHTTCISLLYSSSFARSP